MSPDEVKRWLVDFKPTAEDLDFAEHEGQLYWAEKLNKLKRSADGKGGTWVQEDVRLVTLGPAEIARARVDAKKLFVDAGFDPDKHRESDVTVWNECEAVAKVSHALRMPTPDATGVYARRFTAKLLWDDKATGIKRAELYSFLAKAEGTYAALEDPRIADLDMDTIRLLINRIDEVRDISPLAGISGPAQSTFIVSLAVLLAASLRLNSSSLSTETFAPAV